MSFRLAVLALLCVAWAGGVAAQPVIELDPARPAVESPPAWVWLGPTVAGGIKAASRAKLPMDPLVPGDSLRVTPGKSLWVKLRIKPPAANTDTWQLEVPVPVIDVVTVYQQTTPGVWTSRSAGDLVPREEWPQAGRYPFFRLQLRNGVANDVYVQVRHSTPLALPLRIVTTMEHYHRTHFEYLGLGFLLGGLGVAVLAALARAAWLRDGAYAWAALYALLAMLALAAFTGVAGYLFWAGSETWVDAAPGVLTILSAAVAMLIVGKVSGLVARTPWMGRSVQLVGFSGFVFSLLYLEVDRLTGIALIGAYMLLVGFLSLYTAVVTWRRGDPVGRWLTVGSVPLVLGVAVALARNLSWLEAFWLTEYALMMALAIAVPALLAALNSRSQERRGAELRQLASASQDPLTGLLKFKPFLNKLTQALYRHQRRGEGAAVALVELVNYEAIRRARGVETAEECLLRTVIKLRRLVRDVDTTGRVGENRFGLVLEGVNVPQAISSVASRLIASGLMEEPDRPNDAPLRFHVSAVLLKDFAPDAVHLMKALGSQLDSMAPTTHRPFRFFDPRAVVRRDQPAEDFDETEVQPSLQPGT